MVSRTTKQAARAYQKAHDVPYAEALRRVMQSEEPSPSAYAAESGPYTGVVEEWRGEPVYFDPVASKPTTEPLVLNLGAGILGNTGFHPDSVPATWSPGRALAESRPATLGVYARGGQGKSVYLSTLARNHLVGVPTLVVTPFTQNFSEQEGMSFLDSRVTLDAMRNEGVRGDAAQESRYAFEEALNSAIADGAPQVVIYDDGPEESLNRLIRLSRSEGLIVLFSSLDVEDFRPTLRTFRPGARIATPEVTVMLNPVGAPHPRTGPWGGEYEQSWVCKRGYSPMLLARPLPQE